METQLALDILTKYKEELEYKRNANKYGGESTSRSDENKHRRIQVAKKVLKGTELELEIKQMEKEDYLAAVASLG